MESHHPTDVADPPRQSRLVPWESIERQTSAAFTLAGLLLVGSMVAPAGLAALTGWAWVSGIVLAGLAVTAMALGFLGLYPRVDDHGRRLATAGVLGGAIAAIVGIGLIAMGGIALLGTELGKPVEAFLGLAILMAGGVSLGFLSFGIAGWRTGRLPRPAGRLFVLGGAMLLVALAGELLRRGYGTGPPGWVFLPVLGAVSLVTIAVGYSLRSGR